ncbi:MAG: DUF2849 domain-containing protein [Rhodospirillales bacterium]|jgi:sulfite reductase (NADPH) hemoprotein beta-component|nr:DUF2849 domain-containing protein [Rhodospirillales bacterium]MDP6803813.1 DUF2849 domain-containing protein [Rhodospirillales bacterium]
MKRESANGAKNEARGGKVMTANRLRDGAVVYLANGGAWSERITDALIAATDAEVRALEDRAAADERALLVVETYLFDVDPKPDGPAPLSQRERIRAAGPTVGTDFGPPPPASRLTE